MAHFTLPFFSRHTIVYLPIPYYLPGKLPRSRIDVRPTAEALLRCVQFTSRTFSVDTPIGTHAFRTGVMNAHATFRLISHSGETDFQKGDDF